MLRKLLQSQIGAPDFLKLPVPIVHLMTKCWPLDLELNLLGSLIRVNPRLLWAALQGDGSWLKVVQQDLRMVVEQGGECSCLAGMVASWRAKDSGLQKASEKGVAAEDS